MADQSAGAVLAALKRETVYGTPATGGAGAYALPLIDSPGMRLERGRIESGRRPRSRVRNMPRLGGKNPNGTYNTEMLPGGAIDIMLEAITRGAWSAALPIAGINITNTASVITRAAGSFLTDGFRAGDIVTITTDTTTANNDIRLRVVSVDALTMTLAGTPLTAQAVGRAVTITRMKKVMVPSTAPTNYSHTIEQYDEDIDEAELFDGVRFTSLALSMRPNAVVTAAWGVQGRDRQILPTASSPYYTSPSELLGDSLIADDAWIYYNGEDVAKLTGLDFNPTIASAIQPTIGSILTPDVFMNDMTPAGSVTSVRSNLDALRDFDAETDFSILALMVAPGADPKPAIGLWLPRVRIGGIDAPFLGGDAAKIETRELMIATHPGDTDTDQTAFAFFSSAA